VIRLSREWKTWALIEQFAEFLAMLAGFGVIVSSGLTLVVRSLPLIWLHASSHTTLADIFPSIYRERDIRT